MSKLFDIDALSGNPKANYLAVGSSVAITSTASLVALYFWLSATATVGLTPNFPGEDGRPAVIVSLEPLSDLTGEFQKFAGTPSDLPGSWPSFRGPNLDNIVGEGPALASSWPADGPPILWSVEVGEGYAAPAVTDGTVYLLDYDTDKRHDAMRALSLETGEEIWRRSYYVKVINNHGKSRTVPAVTEEYIVSLGPRCHVVCLDRATGDFRWGLDLVEDYGTKVPDWHAAQCPLILNGVAILAPAGPDTLLMGVECESGDVLWKTPNEPGWLMSHSSVMPMTLLGKKMYVYSAEGGLVGVSAEEGDTGELLWEFAWTALVVAPSPVKVANDQIFMSTGRGAGNVLLQLSESDGIYAVNSLYEKAPDEGLSSIQQTPIFANDRLYCILPKGGGAAEKQFVAYDVEGNFVWSSGQDKRLGKYGNGPFLLADDKFYILHDDGILRMIDATVDEYVELGEAHLLHGGHDAWAPLTLVGSRMLLRNSRTLICIDLGAA